MLFFFQRWVHKGVFEAPLRKTQKQFFHYQTGHKVRKNEYQSAILVFRITDHWMKCLCFPLSINFERFTQELSDYMSCPYKYNQTERELNRFVFNIFITFTLMTQGFARSKVKNDLHRIQGYFVNLLYFLGVMILQFELQKQLFVYRPKQTCPSSCTFLSFIFLFPSLCL